MHDTRIDSRYASLFHKQGFVPVNSCKLTRPYIWMLNMVKLDATVRMDLQYSKRSLTGSLPVPHLASLKLLARNKRLSLSLSGSSKILLCLPDMTRALLDIAEVQHKSNQDCLDLIKGME